MHAARSRKSSVSRPNAARSAAFAAGAALVAAACAASKPGARPGLEPSSMAAPPPAYHSPATWRYHPNEPSRLQARVDLGKGALLLAGRRGERWLFDASSGRLEASAELAPEDVIAILRDGDKFGFIGKSGTSYESDTPLGPFLGSSAPLFPLSEVAAGSGAILAVRRDQRLARSSDGGRTFELVGPEGQAFVDVEIDRDGRALALSVPETLWESKDSGATFTKLDVPASAVFTLEHDIDGKQIKTNGALGTFVWAQGGGFEAPSASEPALPSDVRAPLGPDAGAMADGRASLTESGYIEIRAFGKRAGDFQLLRGAFGERLETQPLPEAKGCAAVRFASFERFAYLACFRDGADSSTNRVELFASANHGRSFTREHGTLEARAASFRMAVGRGGALLVMGACPPFEQGAGCRPSGVLFREAGEAKRPPVKAATKKGAKGARAEAPFGVSALPSLSEPLAIAFGSDGRVAFVAGTTTKSDSLALYVSNDQGRSFELRELDSVDPRVLDDSARVDALSPAEDGTVALIVNRRRPGLIVLDEQGRVLSASTPPDDALVGAAGLRALAVAPEGDRVWESLDGGVTWEPAGKLPTALCAPDRECEAPLRCAGAGCVVAGEFSRVGWGRSGGSDLDLVAPVQPVETGGLERRLRTPIACTLSSEAWRLLPGVVEPPGADDAAMGDAAWFAAAQDPSTASAVVFHGRGGVRPRVDTVTLFPPASRPSDFALAMLPQIEGAAALRYVVPTEASKNAHITRLEVAWDNLFEGRVLRGRIADAGAMQPGDYEGGAPFASRALPDLLSIAEGGLYLRLHAKAGERQPTFFFDGKTVTELPAFEWPPTVVRAGRGEMAHIGGTHLFLKILGRGAALVRASTQGGRQEFAGYTLGLLSPSQFGVTELGGISYVKGGAALHLETLDDAGRFSRARLFPLRANGPAVDAAIPAPTQLDLEPRPAPCPAGERSATARVVTHYSPGTRHPVIVSDAVDPPRSMITSGAVLHGTPDSACAAAFEIEPVVVPGDPNASSTERALVLLDDLEHAWLFRPAQGRGEEQLGVEYRMMSCRFEPTLEVPPEIQKAPGTLSPRARP
jgi:hypothetical protein